MYGYDPSDEVRFGCFRPVMTLKTVVSMVKEMQPGQCASYGRRFTAEKPTKVATLCTGYADGYPRQLSCGKGVVEIHGVACPVLGRVCMDQMMVDVTNVPQVQEDDEAILWGGTVSDTAETIARKTDTISYFVVIVRGADEFIVGGVHHVPVRLDNLRDVVDIFLRGDAGGIGLFFNLLAVLVRAGLEVDIVALHALIARNAVGEHDLIRVADVRAAGGVGDSRRNIILRFTHGWIIPLQCIFKGLIFSTVECIQLNSTAESAERIISPAKIAAPMRTMSLRCFSVFIESSFRGCRACLYVYPLFYHSFFHL